MQLHYFRGDTRNFGDDLNPWIWRQLLPRLEVPAAPLPATIDTPLFIGIGTVLGLSLPRAPQTHVFSSGWGYGPLPVTDSTWTFHCVRGPLTADALGLPAKTAITDGALLLARLVAHNPAARLQPAFMPHHVTAHYWGADWQHACAEAGFVYLDPLADVDTVLNRLNQVDIVYAEAMHGAIVADSLGIPWVRTLTTRDTHEFKWRDWCASIGVSMEAHTLPTMGRWLRRRPSAQSRVIRWRGASALKHVARRAHPRLSDEATRAKLLDRLEETLASFADEYLSAAS